MNHREEEMEDVRRLERQLRQALRREPPHSEFAGRVIARSKRPKLLMMPRWLAPAAVVVIMAGGGSMAWRRHQGEVAKDQVMQAMRLTAGKLHQIQVQVREVHE